MPRPYEFSASAKSTGEVNVIRSVETPVPIIRLSKSIFPFAANCTFTPASTQTI